MIDLGDFYTVDEFKVIWENAAAKEYKIQVSIDGENWKDVYNVTDGKSAEIKEGNFSPVSTKYIRLFGISKTMEIYGFSIFDFQVMGKKEMNKLRSNKNKNININKSSKNIIHLGVMCIGCRSFPIKGCRYKCTLCINFNYCEECAKKYAKEHNHPFFMFYDPKKRPVFWNYFLKKD